MRQRLPMIAVALLCASAPATLLAAMEPGSLQLERTPQQVRLTWSGDEPTYIIYRSDAPTAVVTPRNEIASTPATLHDDPLPAIPCTTCFYLVVPASTGFACGEQTCSAETEYCLVVHPGVPEAPPQHSCEAIPPECQPRPSCACVQGGSGWPPSASDCSQGANGGITVNVYAP